MPPFGAVCHRRLAFSLGRIPTSHTLTGLQLCSYT